MQYGEILHGQFTLFHFLVKYCFKYWSGYGVRNIAGIECTLSKSTDHQYWTGMIEDMVSGFVWQELLHFKIGVA